MIKINKFNKKIINIIIIFLLLYTTIHFIIGGIYVPLFKLTSIIGNPKGESESLKETIVNGKEFIFSSDRQYGPIFLITMYPILYFFYDNNTIISILLLFIDYIFLFGIFWLSYIILFKKNKYGFIILMLLLFNFSPLIYTLGVRSIEIWELFFLLLSIYYFINNNRIITGILIAITAHIKILPIIFVFYFLFKDRRIFWSIITTTFLILLFSSLLIGVNAGFMYWPKITEQVIKPNSFAAGFFENQSLKGLLIKIANGFRADDNFYINLNSSIIFIQIIIIIAALHGLYFLYTRIDTTNNKDSILLEYGFILSFILLFSPLTSFENTTLGLLAYIIAIYFIIKYWEIISKNKTMITLILIAYIFVGMFVPYGLMLKLLPLDTLNNIFCNTNFIPHESYKIYGFASIGIICLYLFFIKLINLKRRKLI